MSKKLPAGMSLLDYLWTNFGVGTDELVSVPTLQEYLKEYTKGGITNIKIVPKSEDTLELILYGSDESIIDTLELAKEDHLENVESILSTQVEIDNNVCTELNIPLVVFTMKSGKKHYVQQTNYKGVETFSTITAVANNKIATHLKVDKSVENSVVNLDITERGLRVDMAINDSDKLLKLEKTKDGLDVKYTWENGDNILFEVLTYDQYSLLRNPVLGKVYFILDYYCIYLNGVKYGITSTPVVTTTKDGLMSKEDKKTLDSISDNYVSKEDLNKAIEDLYTELNKTPEEVIANIKAGGEVVLRKNLEVPNNLPLELFSLPTPLSLDMQGNEIKTAGGNYGDVVEFKKSTVTLKNGVINQAANNTVNGAGIAVMAGPNNITLENMTVTSNRAILNSASNNTTVIKSGTYTSPSLAEVVYYSAGSNSKIIIEGGRFESKVEQGQTNFTLNIKDSLVTNGVDVRNFIEVRGGEFVNFDPSNCNSEGPGTNFVAEGKTVQVIQEGSNKIYKVV